MDEMEQRKTPCSTEAEEILIEFEKEIKTNNNNNEESKPAYMTIEDYKTIISQLKSENKLLHERVQNLSQYVVTIHQYEHNMLQEMLQLKQLIELHEQHNLALTEQLSNLQKQANLSKDDVLSQLLSGCEILLNVYRVNHEQVQDLVADMGLVIPHLSDSTVPTSQLCNTFLGNCKVALEEIKSSISSVQTIQESITRMENPTWQSLCGVSLPSLKNVEVPVSILRCSFIELHRDFLNGRQAEACVVNANDNAHSNFGGAEVTDMSKNERIGDDTADMLASLGKRKRVRKLFKFLISTDTLEGIDHKLIVKILAEMIESEIIHGMTKSAIALMIKELSELEIDIVGESSINPIK